MLEISGEILGYFFSAHDLSGKFSTVQFFVRMVAFFVILTLKCKHFAGKIHNRSFLIIIPLNP